MIRNSVLQKTILKLTDFLEIKTTLNTMLTNFIDKEHLFIGYYDHLPYFADS